MRSTVPGIALFLMVACGAPPAERGSSGPALPDAFPHSMKGYTLYGWERAGEQWFTLITGTNRVKSFAELDDPDVLLSEDGWVRVRVKGVERARDLLGRVPDGDVIVLGLDSPTLAANTIPPDVRPLDPQVLEELR